ncbi:hypothetical protein ACFCX4_35035 [Kitasatospora sp. NPDC056327]|uniref:hypothetical protein n=1 Tax=Kitasatospora sp. NPDC056327 TaxID=3345785 RepID=UPI0035DDC398
MNLASKRWRTTVVALMTALSVLFLANSQASAAQPGEGVDWGQEIENNSIVQTNGGMVETRDPNTNVLIQVWRGYDNNVYLALNHGTVVRMPGATTLAPPAVEWSHSNSTTNSAFRVFHTGTNGYIYYTYVVTGGNGNIANIQQPWNQVPQGAATPNNFPVSVVGLPNNSMYLAFRGSSSNEIWGQFFDGTSNLWDNPVRVTDARSDSPPALAFSTNTNIIALAWRGTDNQVNLIRQTYGQPWWWGHDIYAGVATDGPPAVAMTNNGRGQVAVRRQGSHEIALTSIWANGGWQNGWDSENTHAVFGAISLVAYATTVYLLATQFNGVVNWKPSRQF